MTKLMTHVVVGYPNLRETEKIVTALAKNGSDFIELQIPFSDPTADGPTIATANEVARLQGITTKTCLEFAKKITQKFPKVNFFFMSYVNPILSFGLKKFVKAAKKVSIKGFIMPDLPVEEAGEMLSECQKNKLNFIFVVAPNTSAERLKKITKAANQYCSDEGLIYCVARLGTTGIKTNFGKALKQYLSRIKRLSKLPLAVGFGVSQKKDVADIKKAGGDIAVVGSAIIRAYKKNGLKAVEKLVKNLR